MCLTKRSGKEGIVCGQGDCRRTFALFTTLRKHIQKEHLGNRRAVDDLAVEPGVPEDGVVAPTAETVNEDLGMIKIKLTLRWRQNVGTVRISLTYAHQLFN